MKATRWAWLGLAVASAALAAPPPAGTYTIVDLGASGGRYSFAHQVNGRGRIVGAIYDGANFHAALWRNGRMVDLGTLPGHRTSRAQAVNARGQVVGGSLGPSSSRAFLWMEGVMSELDFSQAYDINDRGDVVGFDPAGRPVLWRKGAFVDLGIENGIANAISNRGQVVGIMSTPEHDSHAFLWDDGTVTDLGTLGGRFSEAADINELGEVVGVAELADGTQHAFLWRRGIMSDLGEPGWNSEAEGINNRGEIVGRFESGTFEDYHAFLWADGARVDLGTSGGISSEATDIDDAGQIVGTFALESGEIHAAWWRR